MSDTDLTWDELDVLIDTDPIALRDRAWAEIHRLRTDHDVLCDAVVDLGGIVQAACAELGIHHDTTAAEVVAAIRVRGGAA